MFASIYHKFVNTTPNPRATKNSSGLLVGLSFPSLWGDVVAAGGPVEVLLGVSVEFADDIVEAIIIEVLGCEASF